MKRKSYALSSDDESHLITGDSYEQLENIVVDDAKYAQELQFEEAIFASLINSKSNTNSNRNLVASSQNKSSPKELGESSESFCEICADRKNSSQMFSVQSCNHKYCTECITKYIEVKLQKAPVGNERNALAINCPGLDCKGILEIDSCRDFMPKHVVSTLDDALCESMIDYTQKFYCPYKNCSGLIVNDSEEVIRESECPFCHRLFCVQCKVPWHSGIECKEFSKLKKNERGSEDLMLHQLVKQQKWKRCPRCNFYVEKRNVCSAMHCRCGHNFCYGCGKANCRCRYQ